MRTISRKKAKFKCKTKFLLFHHDQFNFISVFRLWAEVFHVSASGAGTVKWQQVSEDLVPVNITCIQDSPECVFHITAYNSQVDKILDVRLVQPGNANFELAFETIKRKKNQTAKPSISLLLSPSSSGTRIGQASECFVYWKDPMTNDTWGLNFTSPIDAKQFRECCVSLPISFFFLFGCLYVIFLFDFICNFYTICTFFLMYNLYFEKNSSLLDWVYTRI